MKTLQVNLKYKNYPIYIKKGIICDLGQKIKQIYNGKKIVIITDENVEKYYGKLIKNSLETNGFIIYKIILKPGEKSKSFKVLLNVYNELLSFGITRSDLIVTFGGGVVGDLGGFAASTLFRGIPFIQVPTSLLAQIDSSIGGKVAVDLPQGKNLVGSFYHPRAVFIDSDLLNTLNKRFLYDGMSEVIKYGCIKDRKLFYKLLNYNNENELLNNIDDIIYNCCSIKKNVVEMDEKDKGERMILNFGHTIGHAVEQYFKYERYTHGEAVAIGMYTVTKSSENMGITKTGTAKLIQQIIAKYNLPYELPNINKREIIEIIKLDKKTSGNNINIILLEEIGRCFIKKIKQHQINNWVERK